MSEAFPFVRVTVLGASGCGKTSLINCFVNNALPVETAPTKFPELYYRVVRLPPEADPMGPTTSVCVEIEDTVAPEILQETSGDKDHTAVTSNASSQQKKLTSLQNIHFYFDMTRSHITIPDGVTEFTPFSIWKPPSVTLSPQRHVYTPLTQARMAFLLVFDSNDRDSFDTACRIHSMLLESLDVQKVRIRPYICFVANKIEKDPLNPEHQRIIELAEQYTQRAFVRLMKVSAVTAKNVKRTFWDLLYLIIGNQVLWELEYKKPVLLKKNVESSLQWCDVIVQSGHAFSPASKTCSRVKHHGPSLHPMKTFCCKMLPIGSSVALCSGWFFVSTPSVGVLTMNAFFAGGASSAMTPRFTEKTVIDLVVQMYCGSAHVDEASRQLTEFQTSPEAWTVCLSLVLRCCPHQLSADFLTVLRMKFPEVTMLLEQGPADPIPTNDAKLFIGFFAAQTLCTLCQAGLGTLITQKYKGDTREGFFQVRSLLLEVVWFYRGAVTTPAVRQLNQAVLATVVFSLLEVFKETQGSSETLSTALAYAGDCMTELLVSLKRDDMCAPILDIISSLPIDVHNKKLALTSNERIIISYFILSQAPHVLSAVAQIHDRFSGISLSHVTPATLQSVLNSSTITLNPSSVSMRSAVLLCFQAWLEAHTKYHRQLATSTDKPLVPPMKHEATLLAATAVVPIVIVNFEEGIQAELATAQNDQQKQSLVTPEGLRLAPPDDPNAFLEEGFHHSDMETPNPLVTVACGTLVEALEFLYSIVAYAPVEEFSMGGGGGGGGSTEGGGGTNTSTESLPVLTWSSLGSLLAVFASMARLDALMRHYVESLEERLTSMTGFNFHPYKAALPRLADANLCPILPSLIPPEPLKAFVVVLEKFSQVFLPALVFMIQFDVLTETLGDLNSAPDAVNLIPQIDKTVVFHRSQSLFALMIDLLGHPSLDIRHHVLDFWYSLMGNQFIQQQAQLEAISGKGRLSLSETLMAPCEDRSLVLPAFETFVDALLRLVMIPQTMIETRNSFGFTAWLKYRDACAMNLTDVTAVLTCFPILKKAGPLLVNSLENCKTNPAQPPWRHVESALFVLSTIASRAQAGVDEYIPAAIDALPNLPYMEPGSIEFFLMSTAAARLIIWTAGYIGSQRELFARSFQLMNSFIPQLSVLTKAIHSHTAADLQFFRDFSECLMIEAMTAVVTAASTTLARDILVPESDVTFVLNGLAELAILSDLSMESRCSLVISAGSVLQCLPVEKMQKFHYHLVKALHDRAAASLSAWDEKKESRAASLLPADSVEFLKLFFTALESVQPIDDIRVPPPSPNAVTLDRSSEFRHPVLNVLEEFWPLVQRCLIDFHAHEMLVESACHAVVRIFSFCQAHAIRYEIFRKFFEALRSSFQKTPTVFHLGALRSMLGIFGYRSERPVHHTLSECLLSCTQFILGRMQEAGVREFVSDMPDLVGMTLDCTNTCLTSAYLTECLVQLDVFHDSLTLCITLTPECHHPKVLMTMLLLMTRFAAWFDPAVSKTSKESYEVAVHRCSSLVTALSERLSLVEKMVRSIVKTVTEIFQGNAQWLGIAATLLQQLLQSPAHTATTRFALRAALNECPQHIVPSALADEFCSALEGEKPPSHRVVCQMLQHLADQSEANWQKAQFSGITSSTVL